MGLTPLWNIGLGKFPRRLALFPLYLELDINPEG